MASIFKTSGRYVLQFVDEHENRRTLYMGRIPRASADTVKLKVESLLAAKLLSAPLDRETAAWLSTIGDKLHAKLCKLGLCTPREKQPGIKLQDFIMEYISQRQDAKPATIATWQVCKNHLAECFGEAQALESITTADADAFKAWLITERKCSKATVAKWIRTCKQFYAKALQRKIITENPFKHLPSAVVGDPARQCYVDAKNIETLMGYLPNAEWRLFVALGRYAGLRLPSEIQSMRWQDVNRERQRFTIIAPKTRHHSGGGYRVCPIFPELVKYFQEAWDAAPDNAEFVFSERFRKMPNHRTQLERYIVRAGLKPWPKTLQNLRVSAATDLAQHYPSHVATAWLGHDESIANKFYRQVRESDFEMASKKALHKALQQTSEMVSGIVNSVHHEDEKTLDFPRVPEHCSIVHNSTLGAKGLEQPQKTQEKHEKTD